MRGACQDELGANQKHRASVLSAVQQVSQQFLCEVTVADNVTLTNAEHSSFMSLTESRFMLIMYIEKCQTLWFGMTLAEADHVFLLPLKEYYLV